MNTQVTDVISAVQSYVAKGYDREYRVKDGHLVDLEFGSKLDACSMRVDAALRLESGDDAEDASNIYAITDPKTGHKGLLIDAFDVFDEAMRTFPSSFWRIERRCRQGTRMCRASTVCARSTSASLNKNPSVMSFGKGSPTFPHVPSAVPSASSDLIPQSKPMFGLSQASSETPG